MFNRCQASHFATHWDLQCFVRGRINLKKRIRRDIASLLENQRDPQGWGHCVTGPKTLTGTGPEPRPGPEIWRDGDRDQGRDQKFDGTKDRDQVWSGTWIFQHPTPVIIYDPHHPYPSIIHHSPSSIILQHPTPSIIHIPQSSIILYHPWSSIIRTVGQQ